MVGQQFVRTVGAQPQRSAETERREAVSFVEKDCRRGEEQSDELWLVRSRFPVSIFGRYGVASSGSRIIELKRRLDARAPTRNHGSSEAFERIEQRGRAESAVDFRRPDFLCPRDLPVSASYNAQLRTSSEGIAQVEARAISRLR